MIINRTNLAALFTGYKTVFNQAFADGAPSDYEKIAMIVPSTAGQEVYPWLGSSTQFREWEGDRFIQNLKTHDFTIKNKSFENTVGVDRDHIEDDSYGIYKPFIENLGQDAKAHPNVLSFALLASGFANPCYDGQYFFDTDHPVGSGSVSNYGGGSGTAWYLLDASRAIKPLILQKRREYQFVAMDSPDDEKVFTSKKFRYGVDCRINVGFGLWQLAYASKDTLSTTTYAAARAAMMSQKNDMGKPLGIRPTLLVVPPTLEQNALEVVKAERNADGATNVYRDSAQIMVTPWLA